MKTGEMNEKLGENHGGMLTKLLLSHFLIAIFNSFLLFSFRFMNIQSRLFHKGPLDQSNISKREARWPSCRASDSGARGWEFDPHSDHLVVSLSKIHLPPKKYW